MHVAKVAVLLIRGETVTGSLELSKAAAPVELRMCFRAANNG